MNPAEIAIKNKTVTLVFTFLMVIGGILSYINISRLEDPEFTIKDALIITNYPGASAAEVSDEVTDVIERSVQQMAQLERVTSRSERGRSTVTATIKDQYDSSTLPQVWNELRSRVSDAQRLDPHQHGGAWWHVSSIRVEARAHGVLLRRRRGADAARLCRDGGAHRPRGGAGAGGARG